jgi:hypothetical protein
MKLRVWRSGMNFFSLSTSWIVGVERTGLLLNRTLCIEILNNMKDRFQHLFFTDNKTDHMMINYNTLIIIAHGTEKPQWTACCSSAQLADEREQRSSSSNLTTEYHSLRLLHAVFLLLLALAGLLWASTAPHVAIILILRLRRHVVVVSVPATVEEAALPVEGAYFSVDARHHRAEAGAGQESEAVLVERHGSDRSPLFTKRSFCFTYKKRSRSIQ